MQDAQNHAKRRKAMLVILDGWGLGKDPAASAIAQANTPFTDSLTREWPHAQLRTDGPFVGLPEGQMGNSEVGHLNIGAGRVVYQELLRISNAIKDGDLKDNAVLQGAFARAKSPGTKLHFLGLVSDGGVHSHTEHLKGLVDLAAEAGLSDNVFVHAFTDGRDTDPQSGAPYLRELQAHLAKGSARLASLIGRYYAMDRDKRWPRIRKAYDLLVHGKGLSAEDPIAALEAGYAKGITDEFAEPISVPGPDGQPLATIQEGDVVIFFNFRTDRCRQLVTVLTQQNMPDEGMRTLPLHAVTMTEYDRSFKGIDVVFTKDNLPMTMGETLEKAGCTQIRIAETEKYPHVTFFFSGGRETEFDGERRIMAASPKVATYDLQPEMSAGQLRDALVPELRNGTADFVVLNFANADMVGHTGSMPAAIKAVETVDTCLAAVVEAALVGGYAMLVTADHGNADKMRNEDGSPNTAHTTNPVPVWLIDPQRKDASLRNGKLADLAPTLLTLMGLDIPEEMTGDILV